MTEPDTPENLYERFESNAEFQSAVDRLLQCDGRELRIFDPDLVSLRMNSPQRIELLEEFLTASRIRKLFISVHDTEHMTGYCPRLMGLLARYAHAIEVRRTDESIRHIQDAFLVLDRSHYVRRPVARFFRGALGIHDKSEALSMYSRYVEIWAASFPAVSATTAGLR